MSKDPTEKKNFFCFFSDKKENNRISEKNIQVRRDQFKQAQFRTNNLTQEGSENLVKISQAKAVKARYDALREEWKAVQIENQTNQYVIIGGVALAITCLIFGMTILSNSPGKLFLEKDNTTEEKGIGLLIQSVLIPFAAFVGLGGAYKIINKMSSFFKDDSPHRPNHVTVTSTIKIERN